MALIVEDGSNVADADAYISLSDAEAYYLAQYGSAWDSSISDDDKEAAIRRATRYLDSLKWKGRRTNRREQSLDWPRYGVYDCDGALIPSDEVPVEVVNSTALLAFYEASNVGALDPNVNISQLARREKVDVIEVEYRDVPGTVESVRPVVTGAMDMIECLVYSSSTQFLKRA